MQNSNLSMAESYYAAMAEKNVSSMGKYLHSDFQLISPLAEGVGKKTVLEIITQAVSLFNILTVRAKFSSGDQVMLAYNVNFPLPIGDIKSAVLMTFKDNLIFKIELFYDPRQIEKKWQGG